MQDNRMLTLLVQGLRRLDAIHCSASSRSRRRQQHSKRAPCCRRQPAPAAGLGGIHS